MRGDRDTRRPGVWRRGFTLVELAVVMALVGLVASTSLVMLRAQHTKNQIMQVNNNMTHIEQAIDLFVKVNGRLPCPTPFGTNPTSPALAEPATCASPNNFGVVPWQALGIPEADAIDGWGNFIDYAVYNSATVDLASRTLPGPLYCDAANVNLASPTLSPQAKMNAEWSTSHLPDAAGSTNVYYSDYTWHTGGQPAAYVLISHGANGLGAVQANGTNYARLPTLAQQPDEYQNSRLGSATSGFHVEPETGKNTGFDDIVHWRTAARVLLDSGCKFQRVTCLGTGGACGGTGGGNGNGNGNGGGTPVNYASSQTVAASKPSQVTQADITYIATPCGGGACAAGTWALSNTGTVHFAGGSVSVTGATQMALASLDWIGAYNAGGVAGVCPFCNPTWWPNFMTAAQTLDYKCNSPGAHRQETT